MKLYSEEQVKDAFIKGFYFDSSPAPYSEEFAIKQTTDSYLREFMKSLTPIELPSDEEIDEKLAFHAHGARWVINRIKQQDNGN